MKGTKHRASIIMVMTLSMGLTSCCYFTPHSPKCTKSPLGCTKPYYTDSNGIIKGTVNKAQSKAFGLAADQEIKQYVGKRFKNGLGNIGYLINPNAEIDTKMENGVLNVYYRPETLINPSKEVSNLNQILQNRIKSKYRCLQVNTNSMPTGSMYSATSTTYTSSSKCEVGEISDLVN